MFALVFYFESGPRPLPEDIISKRVLVGSQEFDGACERKQTHDTYNTLDTSAKTRTLVGSHRHERELSYGPSIGFTTEKKKEGGESI